MNFVRNIDPSGQKRDCTIRAIASLCDVSYQKAELCLAIAGKDDNRGFDIYSWIDNHGGRILGCQFTLVRRHEKRGRFLIGNKRHVRAFIDNTTYDYANCGMSYRWCYRVELNAGPDKTTERLRELESRGITTLSQWKPTRQQLLDNM